MTSTILMISRTISRFKRISLENTLPTDNLLTSKLNKYLKTIIETLIKWKTKLVNTSILPTTTLIESKLLKKKALKILKNKAKIRKVDTMLFLGKNFAKSKTCITQLVGFIPKGLGTGCQQEEMCSPEEEADN